MRSRRSLVLAGILAVASLLAACATGSRFTRPSFDAIELGRTRYDDVVAAIGTPQRTGTSIESGATFDTASWYYAKPGMRGVVPVRTLTVQFHDGVAVGRVYSSTIPEDSTNFDGALAAKIVEGETTVAEVERLLGQPSGYWIHPLVEGESDRAIAYVYAERDGSRYSFKRLTVTYGPDGVVKDVEYASVGDAGPAANPLADPAPLESTLPSAAVSE